MSERCRAELAVVCAGFLITVLCRTHQNGDQGVQEQEWQAEIDAIAGKHADRPWLFRSASVLRFALSLVLHASAVRGQPRTDYRPVLITMGGGWGLPLGYMYLYASVLRPSDLFHGSVLEVVYYTGWVLPFIFLAILAFTVGLPNPGKDFAWTPLGPSHRRRARAGGE